MARGMTVKIELMPEEEQTLSMWAKAGTTEQRMAQRAKVILLSAQGLRLPHVVFNPGVAPWHHSEGPQACRLLLPTNHF